MTADSNGGIGPQTCPYCRGKGGRERYVWSRFLGTEAQSHYAGWERCWRCKGTGVVQEAKRA